MLLQDMTLKEFLQTTSSSSPVPGGGSVAALCASLSSALAAMVTALTVGKKNYESVSEQMQAVGGKMNKLQEKFVDAIDKDSDAFNKVMASFKLPKDTDEQKAFRRAKINEATQFAATVPLRLAEDCALLFDDFAYIAKNGNKNALSDIAVATMLLRTAILSALCNTKINLSSLPEGDYKTVTSNRVEQLEVLANQKEKEILSYIVL